MPKKSLTVEQVKNNAADSKLRYSNTEHGFVTQRIAALFTPSKCKKRGLWPACSKEDIKKLFDKYVKEHGRNCGYCGDPWTYIVKEHSRFKGHNTPRGSSNKKNFSIDRLDNTKTYTLDNIVFCCFDCNDKKHNTTFELAEKILELRDLRKKELDMGIWS